MDSILTRQEIFPNLPAGAQDFIFPAKVFLHQNKFRISVEASNRLQLAMIILSPTIVGRQQLSTGGASPGTIKSFFHSHHLLNAHPHFLSSSTSFWSTYQQHVCGFKFSDTMVYFPWRCGSGNFCGGILIE